MEIPKFKKEQNNFNSNDKDQNKNLTLLPPDQANINSIAKLIDPYDTENCKSWFTVDIKLGCLRVTLNKDIFNWRGEYNYDYLEYIKSMTKGFTINYPYLEEKKIFNKERGLSLSMSSVGGGRAQLNEKKKTPGFLIVNTIYNRLFNKEDDLETVFFEENFYNYKKFLSVRDRKSKKKKDAKEETFNYGSLMQGEQDIKFDSVDVWCCRGKRNYNLLLTKDFDYSNLPIYIRELLVDPRNKESKGYFTDSYEKKQSSKEKTVEVILYNKQKLFNRSDGSDKEEEIIVVNHNITVFKLKQWIIEKFINYTDFTEKVQSEVGLMQNGNTVNFLIRKQN